MLARIFTRLFYAVIFFGLGVWAAPHLGGASRWIDEGVASTRDGAVALWAWAEETFSPAGFKPSPPAPARDPAAKPAPAVVPTPSAPAPVVASPTMPAKPAPSAATVAPAETDALADARAAYARGDVAGAIRAYEDLLVDRPNDATAAGELGNVLWANGRHADAAASYHRAAVALIAQGRKAEAEALTAPIRAGDAALADDLVRRLARTPGTP
ncbi:tetratricopeptide repeat protein [Pinisolibacter aquiterrae]|uniref:tetratricopeptide repeat protein n=1 Tax=Pinisolibacter aquiterrae TaxID=2815579 RepID=UPI001C3E0B57|nr:tetratricopeptide repeat protein [Pinisolibacter aquiterrae]MBV5264440.1 hypothetical protein [Pinisolibacter aquiterrae]MCC8234411.1 hypothetical protein [Pinisolibacter aquiterrae]